MIYENEIDQLHTQVRNLKATFAAEKDALIAKYEAIIKENKGEIILQVETSQQYLKLIKNTLGHEHGTFNSADERFHLKLRLLRYQTSRCC